MPRPRPTKQLTAQASPRIVYGRVAAAAPAKPKSTRNPRQVFVAYPYRVYPKADYRPIYTDLAKAFDVEFVFADEKISNLHILKKIEGYIRSSRFGVYDISGWNANVTLELGLAFGLGEDAYIAFDPSKTDVEEVPADLRGMDRIEYRSYAELRDGIEALLAQEVPIRRTHQAEDQVAVLGEQARGIVAESEGLRMPDIARALGVSTALAQLVVRRLVAQGALRTTGQKRGTKYYLA